MAFQTFHSVHFPMLNSVVPFVLSLWSVLRHVTTQHWSDCRSGNMCRLVFSTFLFQTWAILHEVFHDSSYSQEYLVLGHYCLATYCDSSILVVHLISCFVTSADGTDSLKDVPTNLDFWWLCTERLRSSETCFCVIWQILLFRNTVKLA
jgi:hypothetical protein